MSENKFQKGIEEIKKIGLSSSERSFLFSDLMLKVQSETPRAVKSSWGYSLLGNFSFHNTALAYSFMAVVILVSSGGLVLASDNSLPGELLYPVKIHVSEPLQSAVTLDPVSKIQWEGEKIERRLEEVELLAVQGRLDVTTREEIQNRIQKQTQLFYDTVEKQEKVVAVVDEKKADLEAKVDVHGRILEKLENHSDDKQKEEISKFRSQLAVKKTVSTISTMAMRMESVSDNAVSTSTFEKDEKEIEALIKDTEDTVNRKNEDKGSSELERDIFSDTLNDLKEARATLKNAKENRNSGNIMEASSNLKTSRKNLESAKTSLKQGVRIGKEKSRVKTQKNIVEKSE